MISKKEQWLAILFLHEDFAKCLKPKVSAPDGIDNKKTYGPQNDFWRLQKEALRPSLH